MKKLLLLVLLTGCQKYPDWHAESVTTCSYDGNKDEDKGFQYFIEPVLCWSDVEQHHFHSPKEGIPMYSSYRLYSTSKGGEECVKHKIISSEEFAEEKLK